MDNTMLKGVAWVMKAKELYNIQQLIKQLEQQKNCLSDELQQLSDYKERSLEGIRYYYEERTGTIDYSSIPEIRNINCEKYRRPSIKIWKLQVKTI